VTKPTVVAPPTNKVEAKPVAKPEPTAAKSAPMVSARYSDADLAEFTTLIHEKLKMAKADLDELKQSLSHEGDNSTDDTSPTFKMMEDGNDTTSREEVANLAARQEKFIQSLENALLRIKNKTYGICRVTGKLIPKERLRLVPHATLSIEAKNMQ
jgi:RNA polymerase-binding protein DksA